MSLAAEHRPACFSPLSRCFKSPSGISVARELCTPALGSVSRGMQPEALTKLILRNKSQAATAASSLLGCLPAPAGWTEPPPHDRVGRREGRSLRGHLELDDLMYGNRCPLRHRRFHPVPERSAQLRRCVSSRLARTHLRDHSGTTLCTVLNDLRVRERHRSCPTSRLRGSGGGRRPRANQAPW
jgi:hypothetical protein